MSTTNFDSINDSSRKNPSSPGYQYAQNQKEPSKDDVIKSIRPNYRIYFVPIDGPHAIMQHVRDPTYLGTDDGKIIVAYQVKKGYPTHITFGNIIRHFRHQEASTDYSLQAWFTSIPIYPVSVRAEHAPRISRRFNLITKNWDEIPIH